MKIEKISDTQIRCTLSSADLNDRQLNLGELAYGSDKARRLFGEMMEKASEDFGFEAEDGPLMIEAVPLSPDSIMLIITKVEDPEELDTRFAKFSPAPDSAEDMTAGDLVTSLLEGAKKAARIAETAEQQGESEEKNADPGIRVFRFPSLDSAARAAQASGDLTGGAASLYRDPQSHCCYLVLSRSACPEEAFIKVLNTMAEFAAPVRTTPSARAWYQEHYEILIEETALSVLRML